MNTGKAKGRISLAGESPPLSEFVEDPARLPDHIYQLPGLAGEGAGLKPRFPATSDVAFHVRAL